MVLSWARRFGLLLAHGRARAVVLLVGVAGVLALAPGAAQASGSETIQTTIPFPSFPDKSGDVVTYSGTFSASGTVSDTGAVSVQATFGAVPSPGMSVLQQVRTYSGNEGTLTLRCTERLFPPNQTTTVATNAGSCVVHDATGAYAGLSGSGRLTDSTTSGATPPTLQDTLTL